MEKRLTLKCDSTIRDSDEISLRKVSLENDNDAVQFTARDRNQVSVVELRRAKAIQMIDYINEVLNLGYEKKEARLLFHPKYNEDAYFSCVVSYKEGFKQAIEMLKPKWIPVSERMPERHVDVLVFFIGAWKNKPVYKVDNYTIDGFWQNTSNNIITHWMPLPEPPNH